MSELVKLVNESGEVLGPKQRELLTANDMCLAVAVWLTNQDGEVLLARRSETVRVNPGLWSCAVEGIVAYDEQPHITAIREAHEELGITGVQLIPTANTIVHSNGIAGHRLKLGFTGQVSLSLLDLELQTDEVSAVAWQNEKVVWANSDQEKHLHVPHFPLFRQMFSR